MTNNPSTRLDVGTLVIGPHLMLSQFAFVRHHGVEYRPRPALPVPRLEEMRVTPEMRERYHRHRRRRLRGSRWFMAQMRTPDLNPPQS